MTSNRLFYIAIMLLLTIFCLIWFIIFDKVDKMYVFLSEYEDIECETY